MAEPKNVVQAIARVMGELPAIGKDSTASSQQGGYAYRGIEAITSEAQALFAKYGVVFVPRVVSNRTENITVNGKPWTDTFLEVEYDVYGPGGTVELGGMQVIDMITVGPLLAIGRDNSDKGANKAMTQAFKYLWLQTFCISDPADDGDGIPADGGTVRGAENDEQEPVAPPGWGTAKESAAAHTGLSERVSKLSDESRGVCSEWRKSNPGWPLSKAKFDELDGVVKLLESEVGAGAALVPPEPDGF